VKFCSWLRRTQRRSDRPGGLYAGCPSGQFALAGRDRPFHVQSLLGGRRTTAILRKLGILPGHILTLLEVSPAHCVGEGHRNQVVLVMESGLRLYLRPDQARTVHVLPAHMDSDHCIAAAGAAGDARHAE
jgi:Fe2+ transport system protein FeoA